MLFQSYYRLNPHEFDPYLWQPKEIVICNESSIFRMRSEFVDGGTHDLVLHVLMSDNFAVPHALDEVFSGDFDPEPQLIPTESGGFPKEYKPFLWDIRDRLDEAVTIQLNRIRWRLGIKGGPVSLKSDWSFLYYDRPNHSAAYEMPGRLNSQVSGGDDESSFRFTEDAIGENTLADIQNDELLAHTLLREAWSSRKTAPRSALVIAVAAAEVGFKETMSSLVPQTTWLLENCPSPSLAKMMSNLIPTWPARETFQGFVLPPPKRISKAINDGVEQRNKVVHSRGGLPDGLLQRTVDAVRDFLYLLDYYRGEKWAIDRISPVTIAELNQMATEKLKQTND